MENGGVGEGARPKKGRGFPRPVGHILPDLEAQHLAEGTVRRGRNPALPVTAFLLGPPDQIGLIVAQDGADALGNATPDSAKIGVAVHAQSLRNAGHVEARRVGLGNHADGRADLVADAIKKLLGLRHRKVGGLLAFVGGDRAALVGNVARSAHLRLDVFAQLGLEHPAETRHGGEREKNTTAHVRYPLVDVCAHSIALAIYDRHVCLSTTLSDYFRLHSKNFADSRAGLFQNLVPKLCSGNRLTTVYLCPMYGRTPIGKSKIKFW